MSVAQEMFEQHLPLATMSPALIGGLAAAGAGVLLNIKKMTPHFHKTIDIGEVGVWLRKGEPIPLEGLSQEEARARELDKRGDGESHYITVGPCWRPLVPFRTLQAVNVADRQDTVSFQIDSADRLPQKLEIDAKITWNVSPDGDNPVRYLRNIQNVKDDKKDADAGDKSKGKNDERDMLNERVNALCSAALGRVLSGKTAEYLRSLTLLSEEREHAAIYDALRANIQKRTINQCAETLMRRYGVELTLVELIPIVRTDAEVQAQAIRTLSGAQDTGVNGKRIILPDGAYGNGDNIVELFKAA
jgi:hypothetical protein